jgi:hypothetical protein
MPKEKKENTKNPNTHIPACVHTKKQTKELGGQHMSDYVR